MSPTAAVGDKEPQVKGVLANDIRHDSLAHDQSSRLASTETSRHYTESTLADNPNELSHLFTCSLRRRKLRRRQRLGRLSNRVIACAKCRGALSRRAM
jgi:hypothetical protein